MSIDNKAPAPPVVPTEAPMSMAPIAELAATSDQPSLWNSLPQPTSADELAAVTQPAEGGSHRKTQPNVLSRFVTSLKSGVGNIAEGAREDYADSEHKAWSVTAGLGALAVQGLDRARIAVIVIPTLAIDILKNGHSPAEAAIAAGAVFGAWCATVGATTTEGLKEYPKAVDKFEESFPSVVNFFEESLPGFEAPSETVEEQEKKSVARKISSTLFEHARRGLTVVSLGTTAYVATSAASGQETRDTHKLNLKASLDGGVAVGAVVYGISEVITKLGVNHPELALRIQNDASNIKVWYGIALLLMASEYSANRSKKKKADAENNLEFVAKHRKVTA